MILKLLALFSKRVQTYCAFCRVPRKIYIKKRIGLGEIILSLVGTLLTMEFVFQGFDIRASVFLVFFLFMAELFIQMRWRTSLVCPHCGFDPVLYAKKPEDAATRVKAHLESRQDDPSRYLGPAMTIPARRPTSKGKNLSKQV